MFTPLPKPRSVIWVVASHVGTSLLWTVALMFLASCVWRMFDDFGTSSWRDALLAVLVATFAAAAATEHSAYHIKVRTALSNPRVCIFPSIVVFVGVLWGLLLMPILMANNPPRGMDLMVFAGYALGPVLAFGIVTWWRFKSMPASESRGFDVMPAQRVEPLPSDEAEPPGNSPHE